MVCRTGRVRPSDQPQTGEVLRLGLSDTIKRGTLNKNRKNYLYLVNIKAKRQPRGLGRFSDSPEAHAARPRTRYQLSASPERPRTRYRFSASPEGGSAATPSPPPQSGCHVQLTQPTTPATSVARRHSATEYRQDGSRINAMPSGTGRGGGYRPLCSALCPRLTPVLHYAS